jgi:hypothetical protein
MDIPGTLCRELKSKAVREKVSVKQLILRGVEVELRARSNKRKRRISFPIIRLKHPGTLRNRRQSSRDRGEGT